MVTIKKQQISSFLIAICLFFTSCSMNSPGRENNGLGEEISQELPRSDEKETNAKPTPETPEIDLIQEQIDRMSLQERIGQMFITGFEGEAPDEHVTRMLHEYHIGGLIFFKRNIRDTVQVIQLVNKLKEINTPDRIPLFLSIDEEGGRVSRIPEDMVKMPTAARIGKANDISFAYDAGRMIGMQLNILGLNMDYAPVLDINNNPNNPVIGDRAFGTEQDIVSKMGVQVMAGLQAQKIIPVVKHFPGHGDTEVDSHIGLPVIEKTMEELESFELIPFVEAIRNDADAVMIAHILLPLVDPEYPASLSPVIMTDLLRNRLGFDGVLITDDLTMGAIANQYGMDEAAVQSIRAGSDIVLICHSYEQQLLAMESVKKAVLEGDLSEKQIDRSVYRILQLKQKYGLDHEPIQNTWTEQINEDAKKLLELYLR